MQHLRRICLCETLRHSWSSLREFPARPLLDSSQFLHGRRICREGRCSDAVLISVARHDNLTKPKNGACAGSRALEAGVEPGQLPASDRVQPRLIPGWSRARPALVLAVAWAAVSSLCGCRRAFGGEDLRRSPRNLGVGIEETTFLGRGGAIACSGHRRCFSVSFMQAAHRASGWSDGRFRWRSSPQRMQSVQAPGGL
jgi:hypothetical protein